MTESQLHDQLHSGFWVCELLIIKDVKESKISMDTIFRSFTGSYVAIRETWEF